AAAANGNVRIANKYEEHRIIQDHELGLLGRESQFKAIDYLFSKLPLHQSVPAIGLVVTGPIGSGQKEFMTALIRAKQFKRGRQLKEFKTRPDIYNYGLPKLIQWTATVLGIDRGKVLESIDDLAERIHT